MASSATGRALVPSEAQAAVRVDPESIEALVRAGELLVAPAAAGDSLASAAALEVLIELVHDIRSPLASMLVLIEHLRNGGAGPITRGQEAQLDLLYAAAFEISHVTGNALDLARRGEGPGSTYPRRAFSLAATWQAVRSLVAPMAREKGLALRWSGPQADWRMGYPDALEKVLLNLVTNAIKFTQSGSVTVSAQEEPAEEPAVEAEGSACACTCVRFSVVDTGSTPMAKTDLGRGLGLALCERLLGGMGAQLSLAPAEGRGSGVEFTLNLPPARSA